MVFQRKKMGKSTALSVRAIAAQVILQVLDQGKSLSTLLPDVQSQVKTTGFAFDYRKSPLVFVAYCLV